MTENLDVYKLLEPVRAIREFIDDLSLFEELLLLQMLRHRGIACEMELSGRKVQTQMRRADKTGAQTVIIRGDTELEKGTFVLKNMADGSQREVELPELMKLL